MALDNTEEFFIGDFVYYIDKWGWALPAEIVDKVESRDTFLYGVKLLTTDELVTATANFLSYTL